LAVTNAHSSITMAQTMRNPMRLHPGQIRNTQDKNQNESPEPNDESTKGESPCAKRHASEQ